MFSDVGSNCEWLTNCVNINDFITGNNYVTEDSFPFKIL